MTSMRGGPVSSNLNFSLGDPLQLSECMAARVTAPSALVSDTEHVIGMVLDILSLQL